MKPGPSILGLLMCCCLLSACEKPSTSEQTEAVVNKTPLNDESVVLSNGQLSGEQLFFVCMGCHNLQEGAPHKVGPNLYALQGRKAGSSPNFAYSEALKTAGESWLVWEKGTLMGFIVSSEAMVPNTWMLFHSALTVPETERLADYILEQGVDDTPE